MTQDARHEAWEQNALNLVILEHDRRTEVKKGKSNT